MEKRASVCNHALISIAGSKLTAGDSAVHPGSIKTTAQGEAAGLKYWNSGVTLGNSGDTLEFGGHLTQLEFGGHLTQLLAMLIGFDWISKWRELQEWWRRDCHTM
jgi:hypothetical protein